MTYGADILRLKVYHFQMGDLKTEGYNPELMIPSLAPGSYPIMVSCNTQEGNETTPQFLFTLNVLPPRVQKLVVRFSLHHCLHRHCGTNCFRSASTQRKQDEMDDERTRAECV